MTDARREGQMEVLLEVVRTLIKYLPSEGKSAMRLTLGRLAAPALYSGKFSFGGPAAAIEEQQRIFAQHLLQELD